MIKFSIPLHTYIKAKKSTKKFNLNINEYRNAHFRILSQAKKNIEAVVAIETFRQKKIKTPVKLTLTLFKDTKRKRDLSNVCSIADKFICDALVNSKIIDDDSCIEIPMVVYLYGGIDRKNPRIEAQLENIDIT